jgi:hypothetical protein
VKRALRALVLAGTAGAVAGCSGAQDKAQAQLAAIVTGCEVGLAIERDAGEAGAADQTATGCKAELRAWEHAK